MLGGGDDGVEVAEGREQRLGERLHVDARDRVEEHELEQLVFRHRRMPALDEALAQPLAVPPVVRPRIRRRRLHFPVDLERRQAQLHVAQAAQRLLGEADPSLVLVRQRRLRRTGAETRATRLTPGYRVTHASRERSPRGSETTALHREKWSYIDVADMRHEMWRRYRFTLFSHLFDKYISKYISRVGATRA